ncbi:conserved hypothetical protein [Methylobacterium nodulans ORS 2060]|uniref:Uncharacterized protein n=1 Tax=Methylobacterium nodulans (strain LMG 21967 / CNCM I-2342 / ORS 2060) TaxID=460265 RepID=B8IA68_METNO|nr:conserved hypothetical protein [Methylobacterium nodulans ORS 2060]
MAEPPERADPLPAWTAKDIERWVIIPLRLLRESAIATGPGAALLSADLERPGASFDILGLARTVLTDKDELLALKTYARIRAAGGDAEASIAEWCREKGWNERTFHRRRVRACERLAAAKNAASLAERENRFGVRTQSA